jgi:hypothetical protein
LAIDTENTGVSDLDIKENPAPESLRLKAKERPMKNQRRILVLSLVAAVLVVSSVTFAKKLGPPGGQIYANDRMFRTIETPTDLPNHGKFDTIYVLGDMLVPVADAAPGEMEYNGGRWEVRVVEFLTISPMQFTNDDDLKAAAGRGEISIGPVVKRFVCPLIRSH